MDPSPTEAGEAAPAASGGTAAPPPVPGEAAEAAPVAAVDDGGVAAPSPVPDQGGREPPPAGGEKEKKKKKKKTPLRAYGGFLLARSRPQQPSMTVAWRRHLRCLAKGGGSRRLRGGRRRRKRRRRHPPQGEGEAPDGATKAACKIEFEAPGPSLACWDCGAPVDEFDDDGYKRRCPYCCCAWPRGAGAAACGRAAWRWEPGEEAESVDCERESEAAKAA